MGSGIAIGYVNFTVCLLLLTGGAILVVDMKGYELKGMVKEKKVSRFLGWFNIVLGVVTFVGYWVYKKMA